MDIIDQYLSILLEPIIGSKCASALTAGDSIIDRIKNPCFSLLVSKVLGIGIIVGGSIVKVPQILKIVSAKSAQGISFISYILETFALTVSVIYNYRRDNPFSTYGESFFMTIQNLLILLMICFYGKNLSGMAFTSLFFAGLVAALLNPTIAPTEILVTLQWTAIATSTASKLPQIYSNFVAKSTGLLSPITLGLQFIGSAARIFTTLREVSDPSVLASFVIAASLNALLFAQVIVYWGNDTKKSESSKKPTATTSAATPKKKVKKAE